MHILLQFGPWLGILWGWVTDMVKTFFLILPRVTVFMWISVAYLTKACSWRRGVFVSLNMIDGLGITGYEGIFLRVCECTVSTENTQGDLDECS
ncbi:hypothetical protein ACB098_07G152500 [Castanea mollissima]